MRAALLAALLALLAAPAVAGAAIVPQRGIAGVSLSMTERAARVRLGKPRSVVDRTGELGRFRTLRYRGLDVLVHRGVVVDVTTTRPSERTKTGVGVGSSERAVRAGLPGARCQPYAPGTRHCILGAYVDGRRVTDFVLREGRVIEVAVGIVFLD